MKIYVIFVKNENIIFIFYDKYVFQKELCIFSNSYAI